MGNEKRKARLEKSGGGGGGGGGGAEFIGFSAFATADSSSSALSPSSTDDTSGISTSNKNNRGTKPSFSWSPVYMGGDSQVGLLFKRIGQKRDAHTKVKALTEELRVYFADESVPRKDQVAALSHLLFLYYSKLHYDDVSAVRSASLSALAAARKRLPKVWKSLVMEQHPEIYGMLWCAQADPSAEVQSAAGMVREGGDDFHTAADRWRAYFVNGLLVYARRILGYNRPKAMHEDLFATSTHSSTSTSTSTTNTAMTNRKKNAQQLSSPDAKTSTALSDFEREQLDERFERIVTTTLSGLALWIQQYPETDGKGDGDGNGKGENDEENSLFRYEMVITDGFLWKPLTASKSSIRRKSYALLVALCRNAKSIICGTIGLSALPKIIMTALAQEKVAANIPVLFEAILMYLNSQGSERDHGEKDDHSAVKMDMDALTKRLGGVLKKACFGASVAFWGPTMLPLLVSIKDESLTVALLTNLWVGIEVALGPSEALGIAAAVAECTFFFLLRQREASQVDAIGKTKTEEENQTSSSFDFVEYANTMANLWIEALKAYLSATKIGPVAQQSDQWLEQVLARSLHRMDQVNANHDRQTCALYRIRKPFWNQLLPHVLLEKAIDTSRLHRLVLAVKRERETAALQIVPCSTSGQQQTTRLRDIIRQKFHSILSDYQSASGSVPSLQAYNMMIASLEYCGPSTIFKTEEDDDGNHRATQLDEFLMNDLLRWTVIHSSLLPSGGSPSPSLALAKKDFQILKLCLPVVQSPLKQKSYWESVLQEIIAAKCNLATLRSCLSLLVLPETDDNHTEDNQFDWIGIVKCRQLDEFAMQVAQEVANPEESDHRSRELFFKLCAGLVPGRPRMLVSRRVIEGWMNALSLMGSHEEMEDPWDPLLRTLLLLTLEGQILNEDEQCRILLQTLHKRSHLLTDVVPKLATKGDLRKRFLKEAIHAVTEDLGGLCRTIEQPSVSKIMSWSQRAHLVATLMLSLGEESPSLEIFGLADLRIWREVGREDTVRRNLFLALMKFLESFESHAERLALFHGSIPTSELFVAILSAVSGGSLYASRFGTRKRDEACAQLLSTLGGKESIGSDLLENSRDAIIAAMKKSMMNSVGVKEQAMLQNQLSVLSELILLLYGVKKEADDGKVDPSKVSEGDKLWYLSHSDDPTSLEEVTIAKVHRDDFPRLYFTIIVGRDETRVEKQTISERLRSKGSTLDGGFSTDTLQSREAVSSRLVEELVKPYLIQDRNNIDTSPKREVAADILNIVISQCGLPGKAGLGSTRYDVFQLLLALDSQVKTALSGELSEDAVAECTSTLRLLSFSFGLGCATPPSRSSLANLSIDPGSSICAILDFIEERNASIELKFARAVLMWISVALPAMKESSLQMKSVQVIYELSPIVLKFGEHCVVADALVVMHCVREAQRIPLLPSEEVNSAEVSTYSGLIGAFCSLDIDRLGYSHENQGGALGLWYKPLESIFDANMRSSRSQALQLASRKSADLLLGLLIVAEKRWLALRLLVEAGAVDKSLHDHDGVEALADSTQQRLAEWRLEFVVPEEGEELEDNLILVNRWLPHELMTEVERWIDHHLDYEDDDVEAPAIGRMFTWLALLQYMESATNADMRNRVAFSAYIAKCGAVVNMLDLVLMYLPFTHADRNGKQITITTLDDILVNEEHVEPEKLSSLVLYRTIEVFPTLSKHWWEEYCPKSISAAVSMFVETMVAPETLRRELHRIQAATSSLGEVTVSGSVVSREVTAVYLQDECELSVVISIPPNFPLRNAEVDGRKTLGIPKKRWNAWALQIRLMLNNQDGTLLDALLLWKDNIDKEFEGVEPCPVCYSVLSVKTYELPNLECKTCHNCFHSSCLYKWFASSGKSQCVLCQQPWSGTRI